MKSLSIAEDACWILSRIIVAVILRTEAQKYHTNINSFWPKWSRLGSVIINPQKVRQH